MLTAALTAAGLVITREGATDPRQETVMYSIDADTKEAHWASGAVPASDWSRSLLSEPAVPLEEAFPWSAGAELWHGPAPAADLSPPAVTVLSDVTRGGTRELTLRLSSRRDASTLGLWVDADSATVKSATVGGRDVRPTDPKANGHLGSASMGRRWMASRYGWSWTSTPTVSRSGSPTPLTILVWCLASRHRLRVECLSHPRWW